MTDPAGPESPPPRTTGGNWRWEPPSPAELEAMLPGYTVEKLLGRGGMGAVYKAVQTSLDRPVAIKILPGGIEKEDHSYAERFRNEAKVMARLLHPAIVAVFDFGQTPGGQLYFVMEYVDGTDVHQLITSQTRLPADHALAITAHVCDALTAAHALGIVHRDIKPANVLINLQGQVKVADFGLAKIEEPGQHGLTKTGYALGTPDFVAPEALVLGVNVDGRADLYAVGVMLYQMLTGELPRGAWKAPSEKIPDLDPRFDDIVVRALQGDPADRHQCATELRRDLDIILTVPFVKADAPATAALPRQAVAQVPAQRSAAAKVAPRGTRRAGGNPRHTSPVKPPAPAAQGAGSGNTVGYLSLGIGAVALLAGGIFYAITANRGASGPPAAPLPDAFELAGTDSPEKASPAPPAKQPPPIPDAFALGDAPADPPTVPDRTTGGFGAYPAGLKVPVPDWLRQASEEGGRLEFIKTEGIPAEFDPLFDLGEAGKFDDFVAVYRAPYAWMAVRRNGDLWGRSWNGSFQTFTSFGPIRTASVVRAWHPIVVDVERKLHSFPSSGKPTQVPGVSGLQSALGKSPSSTGSLYVLLGSGYATLETRNTLPDEIPPPPDFFRDAVVVGASSISFFAAKPGQPLRGWDPKTGKPVPIQNPPSDVVAIAGGGSVFTLLTSEGGVRVIHATTGIDNLIGSKPPSNLGPALRVRNGGICFLAQRTNGTWAGWQLASDQQTSDRRELISLIEGFGPALDMETGAIRLPGQELVGFWALTIKPKSTSPPAAAPKLTTNPTPVPPTTSDPATPIVPAWLVEARQRGGKVRFFGTMPKGATQRGRIEALTDVIDVEAKGHGVAARRASSETHVLAWKSTAPGGALTPAPFSTPTLGGNSVLGLWSPDDRAFHQVWAGQFVRAREVDGTTAVRSVSTHYQVCLLNEQGLIVQSAARPVADEKRKSGGDPPPEDFFEGATAFAGTQLHFLSAKPGRQVQSWDTFKKSTIEFPAEIRDVVSIQTANISDHVVSLTRDGKVFVTSVTGGPRGDATLEVPKDLGPAIAIAAGRSMCAAQMIDGTWRAWGKSKTLVDQIAKIGPAIDVALDWADAGPEQAEYLLWIEPPAVTPAPAPAMTQATPPQAATPSAPLLARSGRVRFFSPDATLALRADFVRDLEDVALVTATSLGWAVQRENGDVLGVRLFPTDGDAPQSPKPFGPIPGKPLVRGESLRIRHAGDAAMYSFSSTSGVALGRNTHFANPRSVAIIGVVGHSVALGPDGEILAQSETTDLKSPPDDFFKGATRYASTFGSYLAVNEDGIPRIWNVQRGVLESLPDSLGGIVEIEGAADYFILLDKNGRVSVTNPGGGPSGKAVGNVPPDLPPATAVRAGNGMAAARMKDGTWIAWGESPELVEQTKKIGAALDVDFNFGRQQGLDYMVWIEPPAVTPAPAPVMTQATPPQAEPSAVNTPAATAPTASPPPALDITAIPGLKSRLEGYLGARRSQVGDLAAQYLRGLDARLNQAADAGDLSLSKAFRDEKARVEALQKTLATPPADLLAAAAESATLPGLPEASPDGLTTLRATWQTERQKIRDDLDGKLRQSLQALESELTKAREFEKAEAVAAYREAFGKGAAVTPSPPATKGSAATTPSSPPSPAGESPIASTTLKLPPWLEQAAKVGGKLRVWGTNKGIPIDEKEVLKDLRSSDFTKVMTGPGGLIFGMRQNGKGYHLAIDTQDPILNPVESGKIQAMDRTDGVCLADDFVWRSGRRSGDQLKMGKNPIILGGGTGVLLIRLESNDWIANGYNWNSPEDPSIQPTMRTICDQLKADEASVVATTMNSVHWITKDNRLRCHDIKLRPGSATEIAVKTQPKEPIIELFSTSGRFGRWAARGVSGAVYSERTGGSDTPIPELSPALEMRYSNSALAVRAPDGTWRVTSTDDKLNQFIPSIGPALDLDLYNNAGADTRIVLWIEPNSDLKPK